MGAIRRDRHHAASGQIIDWIDTSVNRLLMSSLLRTLPLTPLSVPQSLAVSVIVIPAPLHRQKQEDEAVISVFLLLAAR